MAVSSTSVFIPDPEFFEVQLRHNNGATPHYKTFEEAAAIANRDLTVWKYSFSLKEKGETVYFRLVRDDTDPNLWVNCPLAPRAAGVRIGAPEPLPAEVVQLLLKAGLPRVQ